MITFWSFFQNALGLEVAPQNLTLGNMAARCVVVFIVAVIIGRLADRRALGGNAAFDVMLGVILGSVLSRGINGQASFFPTLGVGVVLVLLHRVLAVVAYRFHFISCLVKGRDRLLVRNGVCDDAAMREFDVTRDDLLENLRMDGNVADLKEVLEARLERNGRISVIKRD
jgi:uncharacterized membrane protein YcaP (DUF421 family)